MKHLVLLMLLLAGAFGVSAQGQHRDAMVVKTNGGETVNFYFDQKPEMTFSGENVEITAASNKVLYAMSEVAQIYFDEGTGIEDTETVSDIRFYFAGDLLRAEGLEPESLIGIYSVGGVLMVNAQADENGAASISTEAFPQGIYIVRTNKISYKIVKG